MTLEKYIAAVQACPRVSWTERGLTCRGLGRPFRPFVAKATGYVVRRARGNRLAVVRDGDLTDPLALTMHARESRPSRLRGVIHLAPHEAEYL